MAARTGRGTSYGQNLYTASAIMDPYPHYLRMRERGPVVWLSHHRMYALPRYAECRSILRDDTTFSSAHGVGLNIFTNYLSRGTTVASDGAAHTRRRKMIAHRMLPRALSAIAGDIDRLSADIVDTATGRGVVDGVNDIAYAVAMSVIPDLIGWPHSHRDSLLPWGVATFNTLGPVNWRALKAAPGGIAMLYAARQAVRRRTVIAGSMADELLKAADDGSVSRDDCAKLMIDYLAPSLDTTIGAITHALHLFARHRDQWEILKADKTLAANAFDEILRYETPLRAFTRKVRTPTEIAGVALPAGSRVMVMFASANRDESVWHQADTFDVHRDARRHLGFGYGIHSCAGQALARMLAGAILRELLNRVDHFELAGVPRWSDNNTIRRHTYLPLRLARA